MPDWERLKSPYATPLLADLHAAAKLGDALRNKGNLIGLAQGCFDLLQVGHIEYLAKCRSLCDFMVVGIDSDRKAEKRKGRRPIVSEADRAESVRYLRPVDAVIIKRVEWFHLELLNILLPSRYFATETKHYSREDFSDIEALNCELILLDRLREGESTSTLVQRIQAAI